MGAVCTGIAGGIDISKEMIIEAKYDTSVTKFMVQLVHLDKQIIMF